jgi:hypothetical protein
MTRRGRHAVADPECVAALQHILNETGAAIVISSSWRFCGLEEMRLILDFWGVSGCVVGCTPDLSRKRGTLYVAECRGHEIQAWLDECTKHVTSFVILDDDADMNGLSDMLVKTEFESGLTMADADKAVKLLARAQAERSGK